MARQFVPQHNVLVNLDVTARGAARVERVLTYLVRSRIRYAITESPALSESILSQFWENIQYDYSSTPPVIKTKVNNRQVIFSATHLRDILRLGTVEQESGPTCYSQEFISGALERMGYAGPVNGRQFHKIFVYGKWRFLFHVLINVFGSRKGNSDELSPKLLSALLSLVYNKPFSFSKYIFTELRLQINAYSGLHFLLYPRFCMLIIRHCLPDLELPVGDLAVDVIGSQVYNAMFQGSAVGGNALLSRRPLFGHLVHQNYVAPPGDLFMDTDVYTSSTDDDSDHMQTDDDMEVFPSPIRPSSPVRTSTSRAIPISERISQLEDTVHELEDLMELNSEDRLQLWNALLAQNRAYATLVQIHKEEALNMQQQINELKSNVTQLQQILSSQGEIGTTSRRSARRNR